MSIRSRPKKAALLLSMYGALFLFFANTSPRNLYPLLLVLPVLWFFVALSISLYWISMVIPSEKQALLTKAQRISRSCLIAGIPSGLLLLQSIDQLTLKDLLLVSLFGIIALSYSRRFQLLQKRE